VTERDSTPIVASVNGEEPAAEAEAEPLAEPTQEIPATARNRTPSAENRALKGEVSELKTKQRWMTIGKAAGWALMAATATYGAGREDQEEAVDVVNEHSQVRHDKLADDVADNTAELKALAKGQDEALKQMSREFRMQVRTVRIYMEGYLAALSRVPAGGGVRRRAAEEAAKVKRQLIDQQAQLDAERARGKAAVAAARRRVLEQVKGKLARPKPPSKVRSVRQLLEQKRGDP
jgi:hypothetical protein